MKTRYWGCSAGTAGYQSFMADPDRLGYRGRIGGAAPITQVLEVHEL
jgi:hypothetical protein